MNIKYFKKLLVLVSIFIVSSSFFLLFPSRSNAATLTNASATLANPRLSYRAHTTAGAINTSSITIEDSASYPDRNTNHLFPSDGICFTNTYPAGCLGNVSYSVATISGAQTFSISSPLTVGVDTSGLVIATQSGNITLTFTLVSTIPSGGDIYIKIPVAANGNNDGFPDTGTSNTTSGFDFNKLQRTSVNVTSTGGTCTGGWDTPVVASTSGTIQIPKLSSSCAGATMTIIIPNMVNPAPLISGGHTQGTADAYKIQVYTRDGSTNVLDSTNVVVAPIEGVLVSANIDQTLSFTIAGTDASTSHCGVSTDVATYPYAVPWGTIATANVFKNAAQVLSVSTNASNGYLVTAEENDQMGKNGITCTGATAGESVSCIKDTTCNGAACNQVNTAEWTTATNNGLGYSMASISGTAAVFYYGELTRTFSARQFADQEVPETKQNVMSATAPVSADSADVCYRISVSGTQPAGYYYNKVKYTATARF